MVTQKEIRSMKLYICDECNLLYKSKLDAQKCEEWCKNNNSCNLNITQRALKELSLI